MAAIDDRRHVVARFAILATGGKVTAIALKSKALGDCISLIQTSDPSGQPCVFGPSKKPALRVIKAQLTFKRSAR